MTPGVVTLALVLSGALGVLAFVASLALIYLDHHGHKRTPPPPPE